MCSLFGTTVVQTIMNLKIILLFLFIVGFVKCFESRILSSYHFCYYCCYYSYSYSPNRGNHHQLVSKFVGSFTLVFNPLHDHVDEWSYYCRKIILARYRYIRVNNRWIRTDFYYYEYSVSLNPWCKRWLLPIWIL